ncbi:hypothetical protein QCA50_018525 [Cerrena zonata]|uniref:Uncharacterized protein n=1 Tax=Cerrena zonata TaxID=2478898 RepID=A0AAW0FAW7_9APHY
MPLLLPSRIKTNYADVTLALDSSDIEPKYYDLGVQSHTFQGVYEVTRNTKLDFHVHSTWEEGVLGAFLLDNNNQMIAGGLLSSSKHFCFSQDFTDESKRSPLMTLHKHPPHLDIIAQRARAFRVNFPSHYFRLVLLRAEVTGPQMRGSISVPLDINRFTADTAFAIGYPNSGIKQTEISIKWIDSVRQPAFAFDFLLAIDSWKPGQPIAIPKSYDYLFDHTTPRSTTARAQLPDQLSPAPISVKAFKSRNKVTLKVTCPCIPPSEPPTASTPQGHKRKRSESEWSDVGLTDPDPWNERAHQARKNRPKTSDSVDSEDGESVSMWHFFTQGVRSVADSVSRLGTPRKKSSSAAIFKR